MIFFFLPGGNGLPYRTYDACNDEYEEYHIPQCTTARSQKVYFETYGCQMNVSDTEIAWSILQKARYSWTHELPEVLQNLPNKNSLLKHIADSRICLMFFHCMNASLKIGVLGCMAEILKTKLLEQKLVDVLAGTDAYRDLPRLLSLAYGGQWASDVLLSLEETYADVMPVHQTPEGHSAFVSIMRGCDSICSYCIVPFSRGRERSRPLSSILEEGVKEVTLGQNVNSYRDLSEQQFICSEGSTQLSRGFKTMYRTKQGGLRFSDLLDRVSQIDPDMTIRFTSPHPKDFPDEVGTMNRVIICLHEHLPAQSSSSRVLHAMRRVSLSSDFITGFCGETEEDHQQTLSLVREVGYNVGFLFKTHAYENRLQDDVPAPVKQRRLEELISVFREEAAKVNIALIGSTQLVLVEGESKRSSEELCGRNEINVKVIFPETDLPVQPEKPQMVPITPGDYVLVKVNYGLTLKHSSLLSKTVYNLC
uniref:CDK5 regulatory subunit associated protein 1 n=1 Tax=Sinocyclocheilus rhinocerous TaxID=307959 RepID=A0A673H7I7_9TELE